MQDQQNVSVCIPEPTHIPTDTIADWLKLERDAMQDILFARTSLFSNVLKYDVINYIVACN